jgi:toxin ParE1/3/4
MLIWKLPAISDRKGIVKRIAKDNPAAAIKIVDLLIDTAEMLDANPAMGRVGRMEKTREMVAHPNYVLVYEVSSVDTVTILRVLHTSQSWP